LPSIKTPRPIIVRFVCHGDLERVWAARGKLKKSKIFMTEDFPKEYINRRRALFPVMKRARELNHHAVIKGDRLFIDRQPYTVNTVNNLPAELQPAAAAIRKEENVLAFFSGATPLSNFYRANFIIDGRTYTSMEQYFQYSKALFAESPDKAQQILNASNPAICKRIGDSLTVNQDRWFPESKQVMAKGCSAKFHQDVYAKQYLKNTGDYILAEASKDKVWGIGRHLQDKNIARQGSWAGQNLLGTILMRIRDNEL
jgi:ribA/ribD-fused uncharacterized protein